MRRTFEVMVESDTLTAEQIQLLLFNAIKDDGRASDWQVLVNEKHGKFWGLKKNWLGNPFEFKGQNYMCDYCGETNLYRAIKRGYDLVLTCVCCEGESSF